MSESQQDRELVLKQLAEAWDEGYQARRADHFASMAGMTVKSINPYRMKEEK